MSEVLSPTLYMPSSLLYTRRNRPVSIITHPLLALHHSEDIPHSEHKNTPDCHDVIVASWRLTSAAQVVLSWVIMPTTAVLLLLLLLLLPWSLRSPGVVVANHAYHY